MKILGNGVAFFDSGVGGLTVLNSCQKRLAGECFYYYGDNERAPYGNLAPAQIRRYVSEAFALFDGLRVKCAVIACNTVTALCVDELRARYDFPIIGAEPAIISAAKRGGEVFVLTTRATFNSLRFQFLCDKVRASYPQVKLAAYACDGLAGEIEEHIFDDSYDFTQRLPRGSPNAVVLGCTHYIYIRKIVQNFYRCEVFDGNEGIAQRLGTQLLRKNTVPKDEKYGQNFPDDKKNRDGRPLFSNGLGGVGIFDHSLPPNEKTKNLKEKTNECLCLNWQKTRIIHSVAEKNEVYFLGSGAHKNKEFYERMFVFL